MKNKPHASQELYCQFLLAAQNNFTATELSSHIDNLSHDDVTRWLSKTKLKPSYLWQQAKPLIKPQAGYLVCDDSVIGKSRSEKLPLATWQYSGTEHKVVRGVGLVTVLWSQDDEHIPIDFRVYAKAQDGYTKNQHFQDMVRLAHHRGLKPEGVLFDGWYASQANLTLIQSFNWIWITRLKGNRVVNRLQHLEDLTIPEEGLIVELKFVGPIKVFKFIATDGDIEYWATNNLDLESQDIRYTGALRWKIEEYHRGLKQCTGIERCQSRIPRSQRTHIFCSIMAFVSLEKLRLERAISWYEAKRQIIHEAISNYLQAPTIPLAFAENA